MLASSTMLAVGGGGSLATTGSSALSPIIIQVAAIATTTTPPAIAGIFGFLIKPPIPENALPEDSKTDFAPADIEFETPETDLPTETAMSVIVSAKSRPSSKAVSRSAASMGRSSLTGARIGSGCFALDNLLFSTGSLPAVSCFLVAGTTFLGGAETGSAGFFAATGALAGFAAGAGIVRGFPLKAESGASRWCFTDASIASRTRPGDTGFNKNR